MPKYEIRTSQFGLISGVRQPDSDMILVKGTTGLFTPEARKGQLYIVAETDQDIGRGRDACQLVIRTIDKLFYEDSSYSVTSSLRKAISAANKALYQHNFNVVAQKRAFVGVTCAVLKGQDLYIAQATPTQAYLLAEGKLRALPPTPSWNPAQVGAAPFLKPGALGSSLSVDPEFYRAVLRPGDAFLLVTTNLARLLGRDDVMALLRAPQPDDTSRRLLELCQQHSLLEAHGLIVGMYSALSPAAQAAPLSRTGISERGTMALHVAQDWIGRIGSEVAMLLKGPQARRQHHKATSRIEHERRSEELLSQPYEPPPYSPNPAPTPRPLHLGEHLDEHIDQLRQERRLASGAPRLQSLETRTFPPSAFLGEGTDLMMASPERRIDLSDTPGMAALGRRMHPAGVPPVLEPTLAERLTQPLSYVAGKLTQLGRRRRLRRPPPNAMPHVRRNQGLSYRRQGPPFPWHWLTFLVLLVIVLILYGINLMNENTRRQADNSLLRAEEAVAAIHKAQDDASAQQLLDIAEQAIADVSATGVVTATQANRQRYDELVRAFERAQAAIQKLTYFEDLTQIAIHPVPGGVFNSIVVPPPPQGITNTAAFASAYLLDTNIGILYRMPRSGGAIEPFLRPDDSFGAFNVGKIKAQAWRFDNVIAVAQTNDSGPFIFYFRNGDQWNWSNMAGSEEWGQINGHFRIANYEGNLYVWGAITDQVLKYLSGRYGEFPIPWIQSTAGQSTAGTIDIAVDGRIYLLQPDGRVLVFEASAFKQELVPKGLNPPITAVTSFFVTGDQSQGSIFLVEAEQERIIQLDKHTGELIQQIKARPSDPFRLDHLVSGYIDDSAGRPEIYLINGGQVLRASLPKQPRPLHDEATSIPDSAITPTP